MQKKLDAVLNHLNIVSEEYYLITANPFQLNQSRKDRINGQKDVFIH